MKDTKKKTPARRSMPAEPGVGRILAGLGEAIDALYTTLDVIPGEDKARPLFEETLRVVEAERDRLAHALGRDDATDELGRPEP
jgi:hypothetical protein